MIAHPHLKGYYRQETIARIGKDASGNGNTLTNYGATIIDGVYGNGANYHLNDYQDGGNIHNMGTSEMTVNFWINPTSIPSGVIGIIGKTWYAGGERWGIYYNTSIIGVLTSSGALSTISTSYTPLGEWTYMSVVWDRSGTYIKILIYINTVLISTTTLIYLSTLDITDNSIPFQIGSYPDYGGAANRFLDSYLDEITIWDKAYDIPNLKRIKYNMNPL